MDYKKQVALPDHADINSGLTFCHPRTLEAIFGAPLAHLTTQCQEPTNEKLLRRLTNANVGPFKVRGLVPACDSLKRIFEQVLADKPHLHELVGTAGMLCCRLIRGSAHTPSNHAWGSAIDLKIDGELVALGAGHTLQGLLDLYPYFHKEGWYSGMGFHRPDSMHFEVADETIREWRKKGLI